VRVCLLLLFTPTQAMRCLNDMLVARDRSLPMGCADSVLSETKQRCLQSTRLGSMSWNTNSGEALAMIDRVLMYAFNNSRRQDRRAPIFQRICDRQRRRSKSTGFVWKNSCARRQKRGRSTAIRASRVRRRRSAACRPRPGNATFPSLAPLSVPNHLAYACLVLCRTLV
jgi:hypothetical protein